VKKHSYLPILIAAALLLSAASENPRTIQHKSQPARTQNPVKNQQPQVPIVPPTELQSVEAALSEAIGTIKQQAVTAEKQAAAYEETYCSPPVVVNIVLAAVGLGYLIFACLQWRAIKKQAKIANAALIETQKAADAAKKSADVAERSLELAYAAHLSFRNITISGVEVTLIEYDLHNSGHRSAIEVTPIIFVSCKPEIDFPPAEHWRVTDIVSGLIVAPEETWHGCFPPTTEFSAVFDGDPIPLKPQQATDVLGGKLVLYVEVGVNYRDGLGNRRHFARGFVFDTRVGGFRRFRDEQR
jgi:hypothetical protein